MSEQPKDGGPELPLLKYADGTLANGGSGMTLRDYFAGQALTGLIAANATSAERTLDAGKLAFSSYQAATAMLAERAKS